MTAIIAPVSALLLSVAFLMVGHGVQTTIIPVRAEIEMFSNTSIGIISSAYFIGFVIGGLTAPFLIVRAGHIRTFAAMVSMGSAIALLHPLFISTIPWTLSRAVTGFCVAGLYLIIESWLNERATNSTRGMVMSAYTIIVSTSIMIGQVSISWLDQRGFEAFILSSIALSLAAIPVAMTKSAQPAPIAIVRFRPMTLYRTSPAAIMAMVLLGVVIGSLLSLLPVFGSRVNMDAALIPFFAGALMFGGLIMQYPLGRLSDLVDRRYMLVIGSLGAIGMALLIAVGGFTNPFVLIGLVAALGGLTQPLYAIAAAHAYDFTEPEDMVEIASGLLLAFGIGSIFGPITASIAMGYVGPEALFITVAVVLTGLVGFLLVRITQREALTGDDKNDYDLASAAPVGGVIAPDLYEGSDDYVLVPEEYEPTGEEEEEGTTSEVPYSDDETNEGTD